jgi:hypothetical protein
VFGWQVNGENLVLFDKPPDRCLFSDYNRGDVYSRLSSLENENEVPCKVGMASAAALYPLTIGEATGNYCFTTFNENKIDKEAFDVSTAQEAWKESLQGCVYYKYPMKIFNFFTKPLFIPWFCILPRKFIRAFYLPAVLVS